MIYTDEYREYDFKNYRVKLPCNFIQEKQVLVSKDKSNNFVPATYGTDTFHNHYDKTGFHNHTATYTINNDYIFTSIEKGKLRISYKGIQTDEEGYPMVLSDRTFMLALEWYIKSTYFALLWENGKLEDKRLQRAEQEYAWAMARLDSQASNMALGKIEAVFNSLRTLIPRENEFNKRFSDTGAKEYIKRH